MRNPACSFSQTTPLHSPWWKRWEAPTQLLALLLYAAWAALVYWHALIPGALLFVLGGYLGQLHFSLQHEAIHALRPLPRWLRWALGALRSFTEHRWENSPHARVAIVESNAFFGLLYLYNNLHHVHHRSPTMPWYELPGHFRRNRAAVLAANGNFYYRGYGEIVRRYLVRPVFRPIHPQW